MLKLHSITISNYRSIQWETFSLCDLTTLVGKNDVGKSNLLAAIRLLFEGTPSGISSEDFNDLSQPVEIKAILENASQYLSLVDERNRPRIEERIDSDGRLTIRCKAVQPKQLGGIELLHPESGEFDRPTGIDAPMKALLPEIIFIEALADVADQAKGTQRDALGKLIGQVIGTLAEEVQPALDRAYSDADRMLNAPQSESSPDDRVEELKEVEMEISQCLQETFPATSVRLKVNLPSIRDLMGKTELLIREGTREDPYYRRGNGLQRTLYLSLLRALASKIRRQQQPQLARPFLLLFEEPEVFLHPNGQMKMRAALETIARAAQVVISTHSPVMVTPQSISQTIRLEKSGNGATRRFGPVDEQALSELERPLLSLFALQKSSKFLFSRAVVVVEGVGDEHILAAVAYRLRSLDLDSMEIAIVEVGGKDRLLPSAKILRLLGLKVWIVADLDYLWNGAGTSLSSNARYSQFLERLVDSTSDAADDEAARREAKRRRTEVCCSQLSEDRDHLCSQLQQDDIFLLRSGEIEDYIALGHRSKGQYLKAGEEIRSGDRSISNEQDFNELFDSIEAWARQG